MMPRAPAPTPASDPDGQPDSPGLSPAAQRHLRAKSLFLRALEQPAAGRAAFLEAACGADPELAKTVRQQLSAHEDQAQRFDALASEMPRLASEAGGQRYAAGELVAERYRIQRHLGGGGMGEVFLATDQLLQQPVALKFLSGDQARDPQAARRMLDEARAARAVVHPRVCQVFDTGLHNGEPFLSLAYVEGEDLAQRLLRGPLTAAELRALASQLASALEAIHAKGLLHCDLKPANLILDARGDLQLTDFGIAVHAGSAPGHDGPVGTPGYLAPELRTGEAPSVASDLYGFGALLWEAMTGRRLPSASESEPDWHVAPSTVVDGIDPVMERLVMACLQADPETRPESARQIAEVLSAPDPLSAMVQLGESPSPRVLAAARQQRVLSFGGRWLALFLCLGLSATLHLLGPRVLSLEATGLEQPPELHVARARALLDEVVGERPSASARWGYESVEGERIPGVPYPRGFLERGEQVFFFYREAAHDLATWDAREIATNGGRVTTFDPHPGVAGTSTVAFDLRGRLFFFQHADPPGSTTDSAGEVDWQPLLDAARLPVLHEAAPSLPWASVSTRRYALSGEEEGRELWVELGEADGRPALMMAFQVASSEDGDPQLVARQQLAFVYVYGGGALLFALLVLPAWRHLRAGRGDPWGAFRLGLLALLLGYLSFVLQADHRRELGEEAIFLALGLAGPLIKAIGLWVLYLGVEPLTQRFWPQSLVPWGRLFSGRLRDPTVASHLLVGLAGGALIALVSILEQGWVAIVDGQSLPRPAALPPSFPSFRHGLAALLNVPYEGIFHGLLFLALLCLGRLLLRRTGPACVLACLLYSLYWVLSSSQPGITLALVTAFQLGLACYLLLRYSLLSLAASFSVLVLVRSFPTSLSWDNWYAANAWLALVSLITVALWAVLASRPRSPTARSG